MSSSGAYYCSPDRFVLHRVEHCQGKLPGQNFTDCKPNSWMSVDLGEGRSLVPRHYCLRHSAQHNHELRTWMLQGSLDGQEWHTLRLHENDQSLAASSSSVADWAVEPGGGQYRHFRVLQHGENSGWSDYLLCCGIELYGELFEDR